MQWKHNDEAQKCFDSNFAKPYSDENPFYALFEKKFREVSGRPGKATAYLLGAFTNQMFAYKAGPGKYDIHLGLVVSFKMGTEDRAFVLVKCRWHKETGKLTQIEASFTTNRYAQSTLLMKNIKRTGTVESMFEQIADDITDTLTSKIKSYWKGFTAYYGNKAKVACGYRLD